MSIIVTHITGRGIIHGSDSNLTRNDTQAGEAKKLFSIPRHRSALTIAGLYSVAGTRMDRWLDDFIANDLTSSLKEFVDSLSEAINGTSPAFSKTGYIFHIAGYQQIKGIYHPEFYHITNFTIAADGDYQPTRSKLESSEDFWSKHSHLSEEERFGSHKGYIYCNGFPSGRQAYFAMLNTMAEYRSHAWQDPRWDFQPPNTVDQEALYLENDMKHIGILFSHSKHPAPYIGGQIQVLAIGKP